MSNNGNGNGAFSERLESHTSPLNEPDSDSISGVANAAFNPLDTLPDCTFEALWPSRLMDEPHGDVHRPKGFRVHHGPETSREPLVEVGWLVESLIPITGCTFLHGPTSAGKSALVWRFQNAIEREPTVFGFNIHKNVRTLFCSFEMSNTLLKIRWFGDAKNPKSPKDRFEPLFDYIAPDYFDLTAEDFLTSDAAKKFVEVVQGYDFVVLDARDDIISTDPNTPTSARLAYHTLRQVLNDRAYLLIGHDRKLELDKDGNSRPAVLDDAAGSRAWRNLAQHELHLIPKNSNLRHLVVGKSQVGSQLEEPIKLYIDSAGRVELWDDKRADDLLNKLQAVSLPTGATKTECKEAIANHHKVTVREVERWVKAVGGWPSLNKAEKVEIDIGGVRLNDNASCDTPPKTL